MFFCLFVWLFKLAWHTHTKISWTFCNYQTWFGLDKFFCLFFCLDHLRIPTGLFPQSFINMGPALADILLIISLDWLTKKYKKVNVLPLPKLKKLNHILKVIFVELSKMIWQLNFHAEMMDRIKRWDRCKICNETEGPGWQARILIMICSKFWLLFVTLNI